MLGTYLNILCAVDSGLRYTETFCILLQIRLYDENVASPQTDAHIHNSGNQGRPALLMCTP